MAGWLGRAAPFLAVAAVSAFLLTPVCGVLHQCGCRMPWSGGEAHCNARVEGGKFCAECGKPLAAAKVHCTQCGTEMKPNARFCGECGTPRGG